MWACSCFWQGEEALKVLDSVIDERLADRAGAQAGAGGQATLDRGAVEALIKETVGVELDGCDLRSFLWLRRVWL
jgi:hypothetical protein